MSSHGEKSKDQADHSLGFLEEIVSDSEMPFEDEAFTSVCRLTNSS